MKAILTLLQTSAVRLRFGPSFMQFLQSINANRGTASDLERIGPRKAPVTEAAVGVRRGSDAGHPDSGSTGCPRRSSGGFPPENSSRRSNTPAQSDHSNSIPQNTTTETFALQSVFSCAFFLLCRELSSELDDRAGIQRCEKCIY